MDSANWMNCLTRKSSPHAGNSQKTRAQQQESRGLRDDGIRRSSANPTGIGDAPAGCEHEEAVCWVDRKTAPQQRGTGGAPGEGLWSEERPQKLISADRSVD